MGIKILVLDRNERVAQNLRIIVVRSDHAPLQRKSPNDPSRLVIELSNRAGPVVFQLFNLRKVGGVNEDEPGSRADKRSQQHQQSKERIPDNLPPANLNRRRMLDYNFHAGII